ncbi:MAG: hypothetical protein INR71_03565 [Terriglobus roseus]|nr:hypothetical protein [Terriglobus roseus]
MTTESLEEYKLKKVLALFAKRGDEETKKLVKQIDEVAATSSREKAEKGKPEKAPEKDAAGAKASAAAPTTATARPVKQEPPAGVKRARQPDGQASQPNKRVAAAPIGLSKLSTAASKGVAPAQAEKRLPAPANTKQLAAGAAKTATSYAGLKSASKRPGSALTERKVGPATQAADKKAPAAAPAAKPASTFSFRDYMADLSKPKEPEKPKEKAVDRAPESEEQRRKRERKEARRGLRVQFKAGSALEEVRVFEHDLEEESGHDASMVRDVGDLRSEGQMFKQHIEQMDMDVDEDEDVEHAPQKNERLVDFKTPRAVDFEHINKNHRLTSYDRFGGFKRPVSKESDVQDQHESNTLLAVYLNQAEIPPNPREPADPYTGDDVVETKEFGKPPQDVLTRATRLSWLQSSAAAPAAWQTPAYAAAAAPATTPAPSSSNDLQKILASLAAHVPGPAQPAPLFPTPTPAAQQPAHPAVVPKGFESLFATFEKFKEPGSSAQAAQQPVQQPASTTQTASSDLGALLASLKSQAQPTQTPAQSQQPAGAPSFANMPQSTATGAAGSVDLNAIMASLAQAGQQTASSQANPGFGMAPAMQRQGSGGHEHPDRKKMLAAGHGDGQGTAAQGDAKQQGMFAQRKKPFVKGEKPKFVLPCKFWKDGKCKRGAECTYLHE